jgi:hypothetical protein
MDSKTGHFQSGKMRDPRRKIYMIQFRYKSNEMSRKYIIKLSLPELLSGFIRYFYNPFKTGFIEPHQKFHPDYRISTIGRIRDHHQNFLHLEGLAEVNRVPVNSSRV